MKHWAKVKNTAGLDIFISFDTDRIYMITTQKPDTEDFAQLPDRFSYIGDFLSDQNSRPFIKEALKDFDLSWATEFQKEIYNALAEIPCGKTVTYGELAELAGKPKTASRAVGTAMSKNRFLLALPCHRVVAANGRLGGFTGGVDKKIKLLRSEGINDF